MRAIVSSVISHAAQQSSDENFSAETYSWCTQNALHNSQKLNKQLRAKYEPRIGSADFWQSNLRQTVSPGVVNWRKSRELAEFCRVDVQYKSENYTHSQAEHCLFKW